MFCPQFKEVEKLQVVADTSLFAVAFGHSVAFFHDGPYVSRPNVSDLQDFKVHSSGQEIVCQ